MQRGSSHAPIVGSLRGLNRHIKRSTEVAIAKRLAQRRHRRRINQEMQQVVDGRLDENDLDSQPYEGLDAWDVY